MPVRVISRKAVYEFIKSHPASGPALLAWISIVESENWKQPLDIVQTFGSKAVDILGKKDNKATTVSPERAVIDIKGNHLRVILKYQFHPKLQVPCVYVKWIGTHASYDKLCAKNGQYHIELYK